MVSIYRHDRRPTEDAVMAYDKVCGRLHVKRTGFGGGTDFMVACRDGWNDACQMVEFKMDAEEMRDLKYQIGRAHV